MISLSLAFFKNLSFHFKMLRTKAKKATAGKTDGASNSGSNTNAGDGSTETVVQWEVRPGGMLVQKRNPDSDHVSGHPPPLPIRVKVKYGSIYHEIRISPQATFGKFDSNRFHAVQ